MKLELAPLLIGLVVTLSASPAETASVPQTSEPLAQTRNAYVARAQTRAEFPNLRRESQAKVQGVFAPSSKDSVELRAEIGVTIDGLKYDWRNVAITETGKQNAINFTINFSGNDTFLPANFKGKVVVRITSNVKGTFHNIAKSQKD